MAHELSVGQGRRSASQALDRLKTLLAELFQFDQADLDFGIYRIMNAKRDEISRFLDQDLLPQVREAFQDYESEDRKVKQAKLDELVQKAKDLGADPEVLPQVQTLRGELAKAVDISALEAEVYSHLYSFFRRYYQEGDFISLRRYKEGVYAIPYEGEEVKLHWANHDQYYIKTGEHFRDYAFSLPSGKRVHFKLIEADTEKDNRRAASGEERRFILAEEEPVIEDRGELSVRFEYRTPPDKTKQADLNTEAVRRILNETTGLDEWRRELATVRPTEKNPRRTLLEKHLADYTARNTFDYFIHKDLGGFLRRELDFYIKNEVMHLDDIESESAPRVEQYLSKVKALRRVAHKIIDFLAQIEDFQKKLWLKKKFVVETQYCISLDMVPEDLYTEIASNEAQRQEWVRLFSIDEIEGGLIDPAYAEPLTREFLQANQSLIVDTRYFDADFTAKMVASLADVDAAIGGILIHSDNFQALRLLEDALREQIKCIYIDPPYNTASSSIPYKNDYKHSSYAAMMNDRLAQLWRVLSEDGAIFVSIDKAERTIVEHVLDAVFGSDNRIEELVWSMNTTNSQVPNYSTNHEYVEVYAKNRKVAEQDPTMFREPKPGFKEVSELINKLNPDYTPIVTIEQELRKLYDRHKIEFREEVESQGLGCVFHANRSAVPHACRSLIPLHADQHRSEATLRVPF